MRSFIFWTIGSVCVASAAAVAPAIAQEHQGCFMTNSSGQMFDLGELCPSSSALPTTAAASPNTSIQQRIEVLPGRQVSGSDDHWMSGLNMVRRYAPGQWSGYVLNRGPHGFEELGGSTTPLSSDSYDEFGDLGSNYSSGSGSDNSSSSSGSSGSGRCNYPTDIAADGSVCGNRAASVRPGGR